MDRDFPAESPATRTALLVFLPFAAGYFLSYLYRSVNAVISTDLIDEFGLSASALGLLTSAYFLGFASLQIPVGLMLDRIGPRRTNSFLLLIAGSGAIVFSMADGLSGLLLGRALIGFGVAACLMSSIKAFTLWFPIERLPAMTGRMMFVGGLGAISATVPVEAALHVTDWRGLFLMLGVATFVASAVVYLVVPERPDKGPNENFASQVRGTIGVFVSPLFWKIALGTISVVQHGRAGLVGRAVAGRCCRPGAAGGRISLAGTRYCHHVRFSVLGAARCAPGAARHCADDSADFRQRLLHGRAVAAGGGRRRSGVVDLDRLGILRHLGKPRLRHLVARVPDQHDRACHHRA
jgi:MFS family permease